MPVGNDEPPQVVSMTPWRRIQSPAADAASNMALDEALLHHATNTPMPVPTLRFYAWSEPAASFGYFQRYHAIEALTPLRPLIRRPTAGGLVPHDADWTYSIVIPPTHEWYGLRSDASYRRLHEWIQAALHSMGSETQLAGPPAASPDHSGHDPAKGPARCFVGASRHDVLWHQKKIAGAAQRRTKLGLLIQGSVQPPEPLAPRRAEWEQAMLKAAATHWGWRFEPTEPGTSVLDTTRRLRETKYTNAAYLRRL